MEIIYRNDDLKLKEIIRLTMSIGLIEMLYDKDLITKEECNAIIESIKKDYDIEGLYNHIQKNYRNKKIKVTNEKEDE